MLYFQGSRPRGYTFGNENVQAQLYNKTLETKEKGNDSYAALLLAKNGEVYDPEQDVWRLEFQLRGRGPRDSSCMRHLKRTMMRPRSRQSWRQRSCNISEHYLASSRA